MLAGVCGGIAEYFNLDPTIVRLGWVAAAFISGGMAIPAYIVAWLVIPSADSGFPTFQ